MAGGGECAVVEIEIEEEICTSRKNITLQTSLFFSYFIAFLIAHVAT